MVQRSTLCRSRRELSNAYLLAKFCFDTAENEPSKVCAATVHFEPRLGLASPDLESFLALARTRSTQVQPQRSRLRERAGDLRAGPDLSVAITGALPWRTRI